MKIKNREIPEISKYGWVQYALVEYGFVPYDCEKYVQINRIIQCIAVHKPWTSYFRQ